MLIRNAELGGRVGDLRTRGRLIVEIGDRLERGPGEKILDAKGGALVPGLHDHHLHLLSLASALESIACGPPEVEDRSGLERALARAKPSDGWLRGTGYFESVAGPLDRERLDSIHGEHPVRIQHRSGSMWFLNSRGLDELGIDTADAPTGVERDANGRATGRLLRCDAWLRARLPTPRPPDLSAVGALLARYGVTRVTDATPGNGAGEARLLRSAQRSGALPQSLRLMGGASLVAQTTDESFEIGELKLLFDEGALPDLDGLVAAIREAHEAGRNVAIHAVTRTEIHFAIAALEAAGARTGDRLEHASVAPPDAMERIGTLGLSIATQPNFISERGDAYRADVEPRDLPHLYRLRSWLDASIPLAAGTDAPFGDPDPWRAMRAAVDRRTRDGDVLGNDERVSPEIALRLFHDGFVGATSKTAAGPPISIGQRADLCLLDAPWRDVRDDLSSGHVHATIRDGRVIWPART